MFSHRFLISVLAVVIPGSAFASGLQTYNSSSAFATATGSVFTINFGSATVGPNGLTDLSTGIIFRDSNGQATELSPSGTSLTNGPRAFPQINISLPSTILAFGLTLTSGLSLTVSFNDADCPSNYCSYFPTTGSFFGVTVDAPITNLAVASGASSQTLTISNFEVPQPAAAQTAEATPLILIGSGLIFLSLLHRRQLHPRAA